MALSSRHRALRRWHWQVTGQVQGVGFRPFVFRQASERRLTGFVRNDSAGVVIECQGGIPDLLGFERDLRDRCPPLVRGLHLSRYDVPVDRAEDRFRIGDSDSELRRSGVDVTADAAICAACAREVADPRNRRYGYGLTNCTDCGPRFTIIRRAPYDRSNTTMAGFAMCAGCLREYTDPGDRRFHAQPVSCRDCGPRVTAAGPDGSARDGEPFEVARRILREGGVVAVKGVGGFHLAARCDSAAAVDRLRRAKGRERKPFAIMVPDLAAAERMVELGGPAAELMRSPVSPIVLAPKRSGEGVASGVADGMRRLGVMLPYSPLHYVLLRAGGGLPPLVMTSANPGDEPLVTANDEAVARVGGMCDAFLWHDRPIERPVDDSVVLDCGDDPPLPLRRSRGYAPQAIELPGVAPAGSAGLCVGGEMKCTAAVVRDGRAILSQHLGDLKNPAALEGLRRAVADLKSLFGVDPRWVAHDMHPAYLSTRLAARASQGQGVRLVPVQHHHAHAASLLAEHGVARPILAVVCDGSGYGADGTAWGGELLVADAATFRRVARLRPIRLAGGDAAARDPSRPALAVLCELYGSARAAEHGLARQLVPDDARRKVLCRMIGGGGGACAETSGAGRLFDAAAALLGLSRANTFEAESAMALEAAASAAECPGEFAAADLFRVSEAGGLREISLAPFWGLLVSRMEDGGTTPGELAAAFHEQFARAWAAVARAAATDTGLTTVGLTGGVFCNELLTRRLTALLRSGGLRVLRHEKVPPNDGGLALGQALVASTLASRAAGADGSWC